jgi:hypothetical protein
MQQLLTTIHACLRPLARILLGCGIGYREFAELAKLAFVQEAMDRQKQNGGAVNVSRLAVTTGLSRKELSRMRRELVTQPNADRSDVSRTTYMSRSARVMQLWHSDRRFLDESGKPLELELDERGNSFTALVKLAGGDIPVGALKAELLASGAAEETLDGRLKARTRHYIPATSLDGIMLGLSRMVFPVLTGLARNSQVNGDERFLQRIAHTHRLTAENASSFRQFARSRSIDFLEVIDDWITAKEIPPETKVPSDSPIHIVGVFHFDGEIPAPNGETVGEPTV